MLLGELVSRYLSSEKLDLLVLDPLSSEELLVLITVDFRHVLLGFRKAGQVVGVLVDTGQRDVRERGDVSRSG